MAVNDERQPALPGRFGHFPFGHGRHRAKQ
jgi:hypothetical protein